MTDPDEFDWTKLLDVDGLVNTERPTMPASTSSAAPTRPSTRQSRAAATTWKWPRQTRGPNQIQGMHEGCMGDEHAAFYRPHALFLRGGRLCLTARVRRSRNGPDRA